MNVGIVGAGIFGVAAALAVRARGHQVTMFEQGTVPNERASSTDVSKAIRRLYAGNETYRELVERAHPRWRQWDRRLGGGLYHEVGLLAIASRRGADSWLERGRAQVEARGERLERLDGTAARARFPQFRFDDGDDVLVDCWGGYLESGRFVGGLAELARSDGVVVRENAPIREVAEEAGSAIVGGDSGSAQFDRVVVAAGPWLNRLVPAEIVPVRPTFQQMAFYRLADPAPFVGSRLPVWSFDADGAAWYGFPLLRAGFVKVASDRRAAIVDPDVVRTSTNEFLAETAAFVADRMPGLAGAELVGARACLYENTPDLDLIVDWHPRSSRILLVGGGSGHGFKFGGAIGDVIADALEERESPFVQAFRIGRRFEVRR